MWHRCFVSLCVIILTFLLQLQVAADVNGPLCSLLAKEIKYHDINCLELLRKGGNIIGDLPCTGNGSPIVAECRMDRDELLSRRSSKNEETLNRLRPDLYAEVSHFSI